MSGNKDKKGERKECSTYESYKYEYNTFIAYIQRKCNFYKESTENKQEKLKDNRNMMTESLKV